MKPIKLLLILSLVLLVGCDTLRELYGIGQSDEGYISLIDQDVKGCEDIGGAWNWDNDGCDIPIEDDGLRWYNYCNWERYEIVFVDELRPQNCYAVRRIEYSELNKERLIASFEFIGMTPREYFESEGMDCGRIETLGEVYCLKDNSSCLVVEGRICELINISSQIPPKS